MSSSESGNTNSPDVKLLTPKRIKINEIKRNPVNVKRHSEEQIKGLAKLYQMLGFKDPIVIDKDNMLWAGHGRLDAAEYLGMKELLFVRAENLTPDELKAFMLMDNRIAESPWDPENVKAVLEEITDFPFEEFHMSFKEFETFEGSSEDAVQEIGISETTNTCPRCKFSW